VVSGSVGVNREEHGALLAEVGRLEAELGRVRLDLQGVLGCQGKCEQLDALQETVSPAPSPRPRVLNVSVCRRLKSYKETNIYIWKI